MLKDRGTIKWTSLMLPEHVELLKEMWEEDKKVDKPIIDPQELEIMGQKLVQAHANKDNIAMSVYEGGHVENYNGVIIKLDINRKNIVLLMINEMKMIIDFKDIIALTIK